MSDTIYALASARGKSGVAVVRVSGPSAMRAVTGLTKAVEPRRASLRTLVHDGTVLDEALVLAFPGPESFTGEDVVELHLHGSQATVAAVLAALGAFENFRLAEPGEFTRRALENDRLDLTQIEGLADLVDAETEAQRRQALRVLSGAIGERTAAWRSDLLRAAALSEATIDFADEEVPTDVGPEVAELLRGVLASLNAELTGVSAAERIRDGFEVAIVGVPNSGKSTLLNALAGREAAITSEIAGTTRDVIEVRMDLSGLPVTLIDTAGLRETEDVIETLGVQRARDRAGNADLRIILREPGQPLEYEPERDDLVVIAKADRRKGDFSARTGEGLEELVARVTGILERSSASAGLFIRQRHATAMVTAVKALDRALVRIETQSESAELIAEDLRSAVRALDVLVGRIGVEDVLDEIFASFCIGK